MPRALPEHARSRGEAAPAHPRPAQVLVVEDNPTNRFVLSLFLRKIGLSFELACNGAEAVAAWERLDYRLVLMDIEMPVLDGLAATRELRRRERASGRARTPIVALSADAMPEHRHLAHQAGMDGFVTKPIEIAGLHAAIRDALGG